MKEYTLEKKLHTLSRKQYCKRTIFRKKKKTVHILQVTAQLGLIEHTTVHSQAAHRSQETLTAWKVAHTWEDIIL